MAGTAEIAAAPVADADWERLWAPYDEPLYERALAHVRPDDVVLDIGAGDFRLAYRLARLAHRVYAIEINPAFMAIADGQPQPDNLHLICTNAYTYSFPHEITLAVLLMRHCRRFRLLVDKLVKAGCHRLITNARWRMDVELIDLTAPRLQFTDVFMGWYACYCGATGFIPGPPEALTPHLASTVYEVVGCPHCYN